MSRFPFRVLYIAVAARRLIGGDVQVSVGSAGKLAHVQLGQIALAINALSHSGRISGAAEFEASRATARDILLIALAGPAASLAGTVLTAWALTFAGAFGVALDALRVAPRVVGLRSRRPQTDHRRVNSLP